jgi:hypothetical protein
VALLGARQYLNPKYRASAQALAVPAYALLWDEHTLLGRWLARLRDCEGNQSAEQYAEEKRSHEGGNRAVRFNPFPQEILSLVGDHVQLLVWMPTR